jgi:hypothetical protein
MPPTKPLESAAGKILREYLATSGLSWRESGTSYIFTCPRCQKAEKLWMFKATGRFICFYCAEIDGFKGRPEFALADLTGLPLGQIRRDLYGDNLPPAELALDGADLEDWYGLDAAEAEVPDLTALQTMLWSPDCYPLDHRLAERARDYLRGRGIGADVGHAYDIHYNAAQTRVCFPVAYRGRLYGWQGRAVGPTEFTDPEGNVRSVPKVLTTPGLNKDQTVMFADRLENTDQIIVCEGPVDAIKCHDCVPAPGRSAGNVATMGKAVSSAQVNLFRYSGALRIYLALDPDAVAEIQRLVRDLSGYADIYWMRVPRPYKDFGEMSFEGAREAYLKAEPVTEHTAFGLLNPDHDPAMYPRLLRSR